MGKATDCKTGYNSKSGSAPSCADTILHNFLNFFIYFSTGNGLYEQIWMLFSIFLLFLNSFDLLWLCISSFSLQNVHKYGRLHEFWSLTFVGDFTKIPAGQTNFAMQNRSKTTCVNVAWNSFWTGDSYIPYSTASLKINRALNTTDKTMLAF